MNGIECVVSTMDVPARREKKDAGANVIAKRIQQVFLRALEFIAFLFLYHSILLLHEIYLLSSLLVFFCPASSYVSRIMLFIFITFFYHRWVSSEDLMLHLSRKLFFFSLMMHKWITLNWNNTCCCFVSFNVKYGIVEGWLKGTRLVSRCKRYLFEF